MKTYMAKKEDLQRKWYLIDGTNQVLGRMATNIAKILRGKNKVIFTPYVDTGDHVVIINAKKITLKGKKEEQKIYYHHTGYPGHLKSVQYDKLLARFPERVIRLAVKRMLPKGVLGRQMLRKLEIYPNNTHPHQAQQPEALEI
ncbi:MAG: 50S ribosomal protein L13 [bacterium]|nr:50S ribosomal protein L13 [bacterium]